MPPTPIMRKVAWRFACVVMRRLTLSVITANMQIVTDDGYHGAVIDGSVHPAAVLLGQGDGDHAPAPSRRTGYIRIRLKTTIGNRHECHPDSLFISGVACK